ncbi:MAG: SAM-dependent methyltransferase [Acutalibacteraceae bacterium]|nr:SAM-dependent methyltransferase [Acutalibacteraceae bacterium]
MNELTNLISTIFSSAPIKTIISKPASKASIYKKIIIEIKGNYYQVAKYTEKQVFHENLKLSEVIEFCINALTDDYRQLNSFTDTHEHMLMLSKKGKPSYKKKQLSTACTHTTSQHNRQKNYIIHEGSDVPPLIDMGVFTKEGKVVNSMYDKFKQINRFIEIIDDAVKDIKKDTINIIDFGCGKSYLTFVVYYYFTKLKNKNVNIVGLDLKEDVIKKCNASAQKYGYDSLKFELGDINGYKCDFDVDIVITLHACDTATDYALFNAICWNSKMIFSVPCCQHELNSQIKAENLSLFTNYGIIQERFSALTTDAIRGNLLEACGYKTQLLEFVDFTHTPKNILIRAIKKESTTAKAKSKAIAQVDTVMNEFNLSPTLYKLLKESNHI